jgi:hypothetical protein
MHCHTYRRGCLLQVVVPGALVAVVRYGQARQWKLAEAAPHDDLSAGSFSGGSTAQGHQGYWVAQQVQAIFTSALHVEAVGCCSYFDLA